MESTLARKHRMKHGEQDRNDSYEVQETESSQYCLSQVNFVEVCVYLTGSQKKTIQIACCERQPRLSGPTHPKQANNLCDFDMVVKRTEKT